MLPALSVCLTRACLSLALTERNSPFRICVNMLPVSSIATSLFSLPPLASTYSAFPLCEDVMPTFSLPQPVPAPKRSEQSADPADTPSNARPTSYDDAFRGRGAHTKFADPCAQAREVRQAFVKSGGSETDQDSERSRSNRRA
jgi:hypothetical protein